MFESLERFEPEPAALDIEPNNPAPPPLSHLKRPSIIKLKRFSANNFAC